MKTSYLFKNFLIFGLLLSSFVAINTSCTNLSAKDISLENLDEPLYLGDKHPEFMYVQTAQSAQVTMTEEGLVMTMNDVSPNTVYFSNRPARITGITSNEKFIKGFCFSDTYHLAASEIPKDNHNPPNAALVFQDDTGEQSVAVIELMTPNYNAYKRTLVYPINILKNYEGDVFKHHAGNALEMLPNQISNVSLFIDDCPDGYVYCWGGYSRTHEGDGCKQCCGNTNKKVGFCWSWMSASCHPCTDYSEYCNCNSGSDPYCRAGCSTYGPQCS